jgi:multicomponent K+:H+ antiporter subunit E
MSALLLVVWAMLWGSLGGGVLLLGALLAWAIPLFTSRFWPDPPRLASLGAALRFAPVVLWDIVVANLVVARLILDPSAPLHPRFFRVPIELEDELAITLLGGIISLTPGTVTADVSEDRRSLIVHGLDVADEAAVVREIKERYEKPLKEIFRC